jgi:hypothetical protein
MLAARAAEAGARARAYADAGAACTAAAKAAADAARAVAQFDEFDEFDEEPAPAPIGSLDDALHAARAIVGSEMRVAVEGVAAAEAEAAARTALVGAYGRVVATLASALSACWTVAVGRVEPVRVRASRGASGGVRHRIVVACECAAFALRKLVVVTVYEDREGARALVAVDAPSVADRALLTGSRVPLWVALACDAEPTAPDAAVVAATRTRARTRACAAVGSAAALLASPVLVVATDARLGAHVSCFGAHVARSLCEALRGADCCAEAEPVFVQSAACGSVHRVVALVWSATRRECRAAAVVVREYASGRFALVAADAVDAADADAIASAHPAPSVPRAARILLPLLVRVLRAAPAEGAEAAQAAHAAEAAEATEAVEAAAAVEAAEGVVSKWHHDRVFADVAAAREAENNCVLYRTLLARRGVVVSFTVPHYYAPAQPNDAAAAVASPVVHVVLGRDGNGGCYEAVELAGGRMVNVREHAHDGDAPSAHPIDTIVAALGVPHTVG